MTTALAILIAITCAIAAGKIAADSDRMHTWEAALGGLALGPIGLLLVYIKCRPRRQPTR